NPMSYNPPATKYYENSGCISFWFYPTSTPSSKKYLFYTKASSSNIKSYVAVYQNSSNELVLELKENSGTMNYVSTTTKVQLNQWNFFGLNFRYRDDGQGYAKIFSYELYLNSEMKKANLSNKIIMTDGGLCHIGYRFDGSNGYDALECKIAALMIGCRTMLTTKQMQEYYSLTKDYMIGSSYLDGNSVDFSATTTHNLSETTVKQFEIYPLQNSVKSLSGKSPIAFDVRRVSDTDKDRTFNYNNKIKRYAYVADEGRLEYDLDMSTDGTILMRAFIRETAEKQYVLELKDTSGRKLGLYRGNDNYLYIHNGNSHVKTNLYFSTEVWHTIGISFADMSVSNSFTTAYIEGVRIYLDGQTYSHTLYNTLFKTFTLSVGKLFDPVDIKDENMGNYYTYYPLLGQIEMMATRKAYCEISTLNQVANELKDTTKVLEYDELGMLQKKVIKHQDNDILSTTFEYKKQSEKSNYISKRIEKETIRYGTTSLSRSYETDDVGNVIAV
ncbi:MAG: LamG domain-containing protein, partial [Anaeroplasmataceae bacterium]|nr:LamG domain-containing protein [Anaeroplasmataceae bacterium]